jgi:hypothetical protein
LFSNAAWKSAVVLAASVLPAEMAGPGPDAMRAGLAAISLASPPSAHHMDLLGRADDALRALQPEDAGLQREAASAAPTGDHAGAPASRI